MQIDSQEASKHTLHRLNKPQVISSSMTSAGNAVLEIRAMDEEAR